MNMLLRVVEVEPLSDRIKKFSLSRIDRRPLPPFRPGAHIVLTLADAATDFRAVRAYSLISSAKHLDRYEIAVQREAAGRGGSRFLHDSVRVGRALAVSPPVDAFGVLPQAKSHVLIGAGIGITPLLSMAAELAESSTPFRVVYVGRSLEQMPFVEQLRRLAGENLSVVLTRDGQPHARPEAATLMGDPQAGRHLYICGPEGFIEASLNAASLHGWKQQHLHVERFTGAASADDEPFMVHLARRRCDLVVPAGKTILDVLIEAGIEVPYDCRHGACGACTTRVLEGVPLHRDREHSSPFIGSNSEVRICVSRSRTKCLVLDL